MSADRTELLLINCPSAAVVALGLEQQYGVLVTTAERHSAGLTEGALSINTGTIVVIAPPRDEPFTAVCSRQWHEFLRALKMTTKRVVLCSTFRLHRDRHRVRDIERWNRSFLECATELDLGFVDLDIALAAPPAADREGEGSESTIVVTTLTAGLQALDFVSSSGTP